MTEDDRVTTPRSPEEELAAFLEGTLSPEERGRVLERLAEDADRYELLVEASGTLAELSASGADPGPSVADANPSAAERRPSVAEPRRPAAGPTRGPVGTRHGWRRRVRWPLVGLAAAAVLAVVLLNPVGRDASDPAGIVALAGSVDIDGLPEGGRTLVMSPWQASRGERDASEDAGVTRAGMRLADLAAAVEARDAAAATAVARDLAVELEGMLGAGPVVAGLSAAADDAAAGADDWAASAAAAAESTVRVFDSTPLRLGLWLETVRLAALTGDVELLRSRGLAAAGRAIAGESPEPTAERILELVALLTDRRTPRPGTLLPLVEALVPGR